jgi:hypothetical protein
MHARNHDSNARGKYARTHTGATVVVVTMCTISQWEICGGRLTCAKEPTHEPFLASYRKIRLKRVYRGRQRARGKSPSPELSALNVGTS